MVSRTDECAQTRGIEPDLTVQHVHASGTEPWMSGKAELFKIRLSRGTIHELSPSQQESSLFFKENMNERNVMNRCDPCGIRREFSPSLF